MLCVLLQSDMLFETREQEQLQQEIHRCEPIIVHTPAWSQQKAPISYHIQQILHPAAPVFASCVPTPMHPSPVCTVFPTWLQFKQDFNWHSSCMVTVAGPYAAVGSAVQ